MVCSIARTIFNELCQRVHSSPILDELIAIKSIGFAFLTWAKVYHSQEQNSLFGYQGNIFILLLHARAVNVCLVCVSLSCLCCFSGHHKPEQAHSGLLPSLAQPLKLGWQGKISHFHFTIKTVGHRRKKILLGKIFLYYQFMQKHSLSLNKILTFVVLRYISEGRFSWRWEHPSSIPPKVT